MKKIALLFCLFIVFQCNIISQSLFSNLDVHLYLGGIQSGSPGISLGYEKLSPKSLVGFGFTYVIPFSVSETVDLDPIEETTRPSTVWVKYEIKPKDIRFSTKFPLGRDARESWFIFGYVDVAFNITNVDIIVDSYNENKYYGPENMSDKYFNYYIGLGLGFEKRFSEIAIYGFPAYSFGATTVNAGYYSYEVSNSMPSFLSLSIGVKKYFVKDFKKKFGKPEKKRKKRKRR